MIAPQHTIRSNVEAYLRFYGIEGVEFIDEPALARPDRVYVWDRLGQLIDRAKYSQTCFGMNFAQSSISGNHSRIDGVNTTRGTWRETCSPSLQIIEQAVYNGEPYYELDYDEHYGVMHAWEVIRNAVTRKKTDQRKIASGLAKRGIAV